MPSITLRQFVFAILACGGVLLPARASAQWRTTVLPVLGSAPETGAQIGVAVFRTRQANDSLGTRPSSLIGNAVLTTKGQQRAFVEYDRWSAGNVNRTSATAVVSLFPLAFHGIGDRSGDESVELDPVLLEVAVLRQKKIGLATWRSAALRLTSVDVDPLVVDAFVCDIIGEPCPPDPPAPDLDFATPVMAFPYRMVTASLGVVHDTRDGLFSPTRGKLLDASIGVSPYWSDYGNTAIARLRVDLRGYRTLPRKGVLAVQALLQGNDGDVPIDQMVLVGNSNLNRGYTMGRFRDKWMAATQLEWRSAGFGRRSGLVLATFAGAAVIGNEIGELPSGRILPSGGAGIRFQLDPRTRSSVRVDFGVGASGQSGLYVAFNEAF